MDEMDKQMLKVLKDQIKESLFFLWSIFPFLAITPSHNYISLFNILIGEINIRFILIPIHHQFKWIYIRIFSPLPNFDLINEKEEQLNQNFIHYKFKWIHIRIFSLLPNFDLTNEKEEQLNQSFIHHYSSLDEEDQQIEKEALLRHLNDEKERINTANIKIVAYSALVLLFVESLIGQHFHCEDMGIISFILFIILAYSVMNACAWIFQAMKVRGIYQSRFSDLKKSKAKEQEYIWQIYYDWQQYKRKADMFVSFVGYTECWILITVVLVVIYYFN